MMRLYPLPFSLSDTTSPELHPWSLTGIDVDFQMKETPLRQQAIPEIRPKVFMGLFRLLFGKNVRLGSKLN
jgi:hypothetical protein